MPFFVGELVCHHRLSKPRSTGEDEDDFECKRQSIADEAKKAATHASDEARCEVRKRSLPHRAIVSILHVFCVRGLFFLQRAFHPRFERAADEADPDARADFRNDRVRERARDGVDAEADREKNAADHHGARAAGTIREVAGHEIESDDERLKHTVEQCHIAGRESKCVQKRAVYHEAHRNAEHEEESAERKRFFDGHEPSETKTTRETFSSRFDTSVDLHCRWQHTRERQNIRHRIDGKSNEIALCASVFHTIESKYSRKNEFCQFLCEKISFFLL